MWDSERETFVVTVVALHIAIVFLHLIFLQACDSFGWFRQYRIHEPMLERPLWIRSIVEQSIKFLFVQPVIGYYILYPLLSSRGMTFEAPYPSIIVVIRDIFVSVLCLDTLFYWAHRTLHSKYLYKYVHKQHHEFKVNTPLSAEYANPIDDVFSALIPSFFGVYLMGSHGFTVLLWIFLRVSESQDAHSNYEFPLCTLLFGRSAGFHAYHHSHNVGNYGMLPFWDRLMGSDAHYLAHLQACSKDKNKES
jgi:sterol desaturase/sphingolipid hydroxylase (fatty acid hydroxylase superfamily)